MTRRTLTAGIADGENRPEPEVRRKVSMALAVTEYFLRRTIRNAIDIGCGEAPWFAHLHALRRRSATPDTTPASNVVSNFGASRNVRHGSFGELASLNIRERFDLVICARRPPLPQRRLRSRTDCHTSCAWFARGVSRRCSRARTKSSATRPACTAVPRPGIAMWFARARLVQVAPFFGCRRKSRAISATLERE